MNNSLLRLPKARLENIKLVVCDMDGTALTGKKNFSPATLQAFAALKESGIQYTIASARTPVMLSVFCGQCGIDSTPLISLEGALVLDWKSGKRIYESPMETGVATDIMEYCHNAGLDYTIYTADRCILRRDTRRLWRFELYSRTAQAAGFPPVLTEVYEENKPELIGKDGVFKIFVDNPDQPAKDALFEFLRPYSQIRTDCSESSSVSIINAQVSKGNALRALAESMGISKEQVCCFGDWYNDLDMLSSFPHSVAMLNGVKEAREAAGYVTYSNDDDGVAYIINNYIL